MPRDVDIEPYLRRRMPLPLRALVGVEIVTSYIVVRWRMLRGDVRDVVAGLRDGAADAHPPELARQLGKRLGWPVRRTLDPLPFDSRCLMSSLVLIRMLARRGVVCRLVIGVRPGDELKAHAWIEHGEIPLLPTLGYDRLTVL